MSASASTAAPTRTLAKLKESLSRYAVPYYLTIAGVLGAVTVLFAVLTIVIVLIVTNFNILGLIE
jgi:hypothetical protein